MTIHEYLMQACQDDARRAGPIAPVKRLAALILHRATA